MKVYRNLSQIFFKFLLEIKLWLIYFTTIVLSILTASGGEQLKNHNTEL